jgi:hypothetical protein
MYKELFRNVKWNTCYASEKPWEEVYVDCDSLVFSHMLEYIRNELKVSYFLAGMNTYSTRIMVDYVIERISSYSFSRLGSIFSNLRELGIKYTVVFGNGYITEKSDKMNEYLEDGNKSFSELELMTGIHNTNMRESLVRHILSSRDIIRNLAITMIKEEYITSDEPDIYCPQKCIATISHDYDLFLFGAKYLIRGINTDGSITFISIDSLLEKVGLDNHLQLIHVSVLSGTDYNKKTVGVDEAVRMVRDGEIPSDSEAVNFFLRYITD